MLCIISFLPSMGIRQKMHVPGRSKSNSKLEWKVAQCTLHRCCAHNMESSRRGRLTYRWGLPLPQYLLCAMLLFEVFQIRSNCPLVLFNYLSDFLCYRICCHEYKEVLCWPFDRKDQTIKPELMDILHFLYEKESYNFVS